MTVWDKKIQKAEKYLENTWTHGRRVYERYQDKRDSGMGSADLIKRANIFYANVNTLKESLFNSLPKADVSRLHKGDMDEDIARVASLIMQRGLDYEIQCAVDFKGAVRAAILDRLVPGLGQVKVRFEMETDEQGAPMAGSEQLFVDQIYWENFIYQPARSWADVKWVGYKLPLTKDEIVARWGEDAMDQVQKDKGDKSNLTPTQITDDTYLIYEIWDKVKRQVSWVSKGADQPLEVKDDPYGLKDFYPSPEPLLANCTTTALLPVTDYHIAQDQYNQLDVLYARISMIITAIKVAGLYDASSPEIGRMLEGQENKLIPVDNWAAFAERGGAAGAIAYYPVEQVVSVLQSLQAQYEAIKSVLQEITGMSDITRGASNQYETAAAQKIKAGFASVRMNGYQRDVAEFVSGILNIMGEMVVQLYSDDKLMQIVGGLNPADSQFIGPAVQLLRNDQLASYKIQIQADSLVQADWALEKGQRMELIGYVSQYLQTWQSMPPTFSPLLLSMLKFTIAGYRGGAEIEGLIDKELDNIVKQQAAAAANPQPPPPDPEQMKAQAEMQKMQQQMQIDMQKSQQDAQLRQQETEGKLAIEQKQAEMDAAVQQQKMQFESQLESQRMDAQRQKQEMELEFQQRKYELQIAFERQKSALKLGGISNDLESAAEDTTDTTEA